MESILSCIATTEFSVWNDFFLFVVNSLKEESREFQYVAARMQEHQKHILDFLERRPEGAPFLDTMLELPWVWKERILIVEDSKSLSLMLEKIFKRDFKTTTAENGRTALEKIKENYVDVIMSDIEMPEINGIAFFQEATTLDPDISRRFLFFSGLILPKHQEVIDAHHLPFIESPPV